MADLLRKSIIQLRAIAQGLNLEVLFSDSREKLMQKIDKGLTIALPPEPPAAECRA